MNEPLLDNYPLMKIISYSVKKKIKIPRLPIYENTVHISPGDISLDSSYYWSYAADVP